MSKDTKNSEVNQDVLTLDNSNYLEEKRNQRRLHRARRSVREVASENQWLLPVAGSVLGVLLALLVERVGNEPDPATWSVTISEARNSVLSAISILFAGLSIVMALGSVTIQNVIGRFSLRLLRIYIRNPWDKAVIAFFALAATFILTAWLQLSTLPSGALAPVGSTITGLVLLFISGAMIIWYISALTSWFRVDRTVHRMARLILRAARSIERHYQADTPVAETIFKRPPETVAVLAHSSGYLTEADTEGLFNLASRYKVEIVIDRRAGLSVVRGEAIGWITGEQLTSKDLSPLDRLVEMIDIAEVRELDRAVGYGLSVLVDIAIMALSPGVNDPNTAVQVIEEMAFLFPQLAQIQLGPIGRTDAEGVQRVAVKAASLGDFIELATTQIVLYSGSDPAVIMALKHLVDVLQGLDLREADYRAVETFAARVKALSE
jgi:uncharacterized membrane protein